MTEKNPVLQLGHRDLRLRSQLVTDPTDPGIQSVIARLIAIVDARAGVGIAAPQIGVSQRLFIVASHPNERYPDAPRMTPTAMINPVITAVSEDNLLGWEGCLSVPGWRGQVPRTRQVEVVYLDIKGHEQRRVFKDFIARIIQHEYDHLNGTLFLDRVQHTHHLLSEADYWVRQHPVAS